MKQNISLLRIIYKPKLIIMTTNISLGEKISQIRARRGFSQEELAKAIGVSRSSLTQIENNNRNISAEELIRIADVFGMSIDEIVANDAIYIDMSEADEPKEHKSDMRVSVPNLNLDKFKEVLLYILERCAGKPNVGETVLYKLLYFSDFNYYEIYEEQLSGATYRKLQNGPVPFRIDTILEDMIKAGQLQRINTEYFGYPQKRYLPMIKANLTKLKGSEKEVIDKVIDLMSDWSATKISDYSHKDMPWMAAEINKPINYEHVFYREIPYSVRNYDETED